MNIFVANKRGRASRAPAGTIHRARDYPDSSPLSRREEFEQVADILCLLWLFPLTATERVVFSTLLERRVEQACAGSHDGSR